MKYLQKLGKALMLPVACLPICGILMGIGATLAGGCSIGNGLVETAFFSWQGWVSLPLMLLGTWVAAYFTIIRPQRLKLAKAS